MSYIGKEPIVGNFQKCDAITVVNGQAAYTLQVSSTNVVPESANHMLVSLNGILQAPITSFSVSSSTLTFASNLATGDVIDFVILLGNVLDLGTPSDGTVTNAKLAQDIISGETALASEPADTDEFLVSDAGTLKRIDYSLIKGSGKILQVVSTTKTDVFTGANGDTWYDVTGLTAAITPSATSSKILVSGHVMGSSQNASAVRRFFVLLLRDTTVIGEGDASSSRLQVHNSSFSDDGANNATVPINFLDSPSSTSELTYKIQVRDDTSGVRVNAAPGDSDSDTYARAASTITLMEVAG